MITKLTGKACTRWANGTVADIGWLMKRVFIQLVWLLLLCGGVGYGQTTVTFTQQLDQYDLSINASSQGGSGASYNNGGTEVGMWMDGDNSGNSFAGNVLWKTFRIGSGTGNAERALQVGDEFTITVATKGFYYGQIGVSFNSGLLPTASWANRIANRRISIQQDGSNFGGGTPGSWYYTNGATSGSFSITPTGSYVDYVIKVRLTEPDRCNVTIGSTTIYDVPLGGTAGAPITHFAIYISDDRAGIFSNPNRGDSYWKQATTVVNQGALPIGQSNSSFTISNIIPDGLQSNSTSTVSANSLTKSGTGTVILSVANTFTGGTTVTAGTLTLGGNNRLATNGPLTVNGGTFNLNNYNQTVGTTTGSGGVIDLGTGRLTMNTGSGSALSSKISGTGTTGGITKAFGGTLILAGANDFTGSTIINNDGGLLQISADNNLGTPPSPAAIANHINITNNGGASVPTLEANGTFTLDANRGITINSSPTATNDVRISVTNGNTLTYNGIITGTANFSKSSSGTLILGGANTFQGTTKIEAGILNIRNGSAFGTADGSATTGTSVTSGAALELQGGITVSNELLTLNGTGFSSGGVLRNISGNNTWGHNINLGAASRISSDAGTLTLNGSAIDGSTSGLPLTIWGGGDVAVNSSIGSNIAALARGGVGGGTGTLFLNQANTHTGSTAINSGAISLGHDNAFSTGNLIFGNVAGVNLSPSLIIPGGSTRILSNNISLSNNGLSNTYPAIISGAGTLTVNGNVTNSGNSKALSITNTGSTTFAGNFYLSGGNNTSYTLTLSGSGNILISGVISNNSGDNSGTNGITYSGTGTLTLSNANTYTGTTTLTAGTVAIGNNSAFGTGGLTLNGGTIIASGGARTVGNNVTLQTNGGIISGANDFSINGTFTNSNGNRTITVNNTGITTFAGNVFLSENSASGRILTINGTGSAIINGVISNFNGSGLAGGLTFSGTGSLTLSNANTYTGTTILSASAGTLNLNNASAIGTGTFTIAGGTLNNTSGAPITLSSNNPQNWNGDFAYTGSNSLNLGTGTITINNSGPRQVTVTANTLTAGGPITGNFGIRKAGAGTLVVAGACSYTGNTFIDGGTLQMSGGTNRLTNYTNVTLANTAGVVFDLNNLDQQIGSLAGGGTTGGQVLLGNGILTVGNTTSTTFYGTISGTGGLTRTGTGSLTLEGINTYAGATNISGGTLTFNSNAAIPSASNFTLGGGTLAIGATPAGTLSVGQFNMSSSSTISLVTGTNDFALTFSGFGGTFTGTLTISGWDYTKARNIILPGLNSAQLDAINFTGYGTGARYSLDIPNMLVPRDAFYTKQIGDWNETSTWVGNVVPTAGSAVVILHAITVNATVTNNPNTVTISTGGKITFGASGGLGVNTNFTSGGIGVDMTAAGTLTMGAGSTFANGTATFTGTSGFLIFNGTGTITGTLTLPIVIANGGGITFPSTATIGNTFQINTGGFALGTVNYATGSTLIYNASSFTVSTTEWARNSSSATTVPWHVQIGGGFISPINANITVENTSQFRQVRGNFTINVGSSFTLGGTNGGNLQVAGDFTNNGGNSAFGANTRSVIFNGSINQSITGNTTFSVISNTNASGNVVSVTSGTTITVTANSSLNTASTNFTVNGTLRNQGDGTIAATITGSTATLIFSSTGVYDHASTQAGQNSLGTIPTATWQAGSTVLISGLTSHSASSWFANAIPPTQLFSNFIWNTTGLSNSVNMGGSALTVTGTFKIISTGSSELRFAADAAGTALTIANFEQTGGTINMVSGTAANRTMNVTGSFIRTGGTLTETGSGNGLINFSGSSGNQSVTAGTNLTSNIHFRCNNASGITISDVLPINQGATFFRTLGTVTGTVSYNATSSILTYEGAATTGNEFPASNGPVNLTLTGASTVVTLHDNRNIGGLVTFSTNGCMLNTSSSAILRVTNTATGAIVNASSLRFISGPLERAIDPSLSSTAYTFPIGKGGSYFPATLSNVTGSSPVVRFEAFTGNCNGLSDGTILTSLSNTEYWQAGLAGGTLNAAVLSLQRTAPLLSLNSIGRSNTVDGTYTNQGGSVSGTTIQNAFIDGSLGYFVMAVQNILYYRSNVITMNWHDASSWQASTSSSFASNVFVPGVAPSATNSSGITIRTGHTVTVSSSSGTVSLDEATIQTGATLKWTGGSIVVNNGAGNDLRVEGTFEDNNPTAELPTFISTALIYMPAAGRVLITSTDAMADGYASDQYTFKDRISWTLGSIFEWNVSTPFSTDGVTYFPNVTADLVPVFRISSVIGLGVGAGGALNINGLLEANANISFNNAGIKTFRNGIVGTATVTQNAANGGQFRINGTNSILGSVTLSLRNDGGSGLALQSGTCTLISPVVANTGPIYVDNGAVMVSDAVNFISGSASFTLNSGATLSTAHALGVDGTVTLSNLSMNSGSNYIFNGTGNQVTGAKMAASPGVVTISNTGGGGSNTVTLSNPGTTATTLNLNNGLFSIGNNVQFNIANNGAVNATSGSFASGNAAGTLNFMGTGTVNATGTLNFWNVNLEAGTGSVDFGSTGSPTIVNELVLNNGRSLINNAPFYANTSTLVYNTGNTFTASTEWYAIFSSGRGIPNNVQIGRTGTNNTILDFGASASSRQCTGNVNIGHSGSGSGYGLILSSVSGGDLALRGHWNHYANGSFTPNGRAVTFNGTDATTPNQTISYFGSGTSVEAFNYLIIDNNATNGSVTISNTAGSVTDVAVDGNYTSAGYQLQLLGSSPLNLNQRTLYISGVDDGGVLVSGGVRNITGVAQPTSYTGGYLVFQRNKTISSTSGGSLVTDQHTTLRIDGINTDFAGVNFGDRLTTIQGRLELREGSYVDNNAPFYAATSLLHYNTGNNSSAPYYRDAEWTGNTSIADPGFPNHVQVSGNTYLVPGGDQATGNDNTNVKLRCAKSLTIDEGSTIDLDFNAAKRMKEDLYVGDSLNISGTLIASQTAGADIFLAGNWYRGSAGTFTPNLRIVNFNGASGNQLVTNASAGTETFAYVVVNKADNQYVKINNAPATTVTLTGDPSVGVYAGSNTGEGNVLEINAGGIDLNGRNFNLGGNRGFFHVTGGLRNIISTTAANFYFNGYKEITTTPGNAGTLEFDNQVIVHLGGGVNFGRNSATLLHLTTINATLQINANGYADIFAPYYGPQGILVYNNGGEYLRRVEWRGGAGEPGYPNDVVVQNFSTVKAGGPNGGENVNNPLSARRNVTIQEGSTLTMADNQSMTQDLIVGQDLTINGTLVSSAANNINIQVGRDWIRGANGIFDQRNNSIVIFNSANNGVITNAGGTESFKRVRMEKTNGILNTLTLQRPVSITENINFNGGIIASDATNMLEVGKNATATGGGNSSFVKGPMRKVTAYAASPGPSNSEFTFIIGGTPAMLYRPVSINTLIPQNTTDETSYTAEYRPADLAAKDKPLPFDFLDDRLLGIWANQWWEVTKSPVDHANAGARVGISYTASQDTWWPATPISASRVIVAKYNTGSQSWESSIPDGNFNSDPTQPPFIPYYESRLLNEGGVIYSDTMYTFSPFTMAFGSQKTLPLNLLTFTASLHGPDALLHWTLADANRGLKQFEVEHSTDGTLFSRLATLAHSGVTQYNYRHAGLLPGVHYYRLKGMDKDGTISYSKVEVLMVNTNRTLITGLMQNPIQGGQAVLRMYSAGNQHAEVMVIDMAGRTLLRQKMGLQTGYNQPSISMLMLPKGIYKLLIKTEDGVEKVITVMKN